jgi:hypothetical protein
VFGEGKLWTYDPQLNQVTVEHKAEGPSGHIPSGFSLAAMSRDFARWGWRVTIRLLDDRVVAGRRVHQVTLVQRSDAGRTLMLVDAATDLPIRYEMQLEKDGKWTTQMLSEVRYNEPLPASLFEPRFPKSAPVVDLERGRQDWEQRLAKGIARKNVGDRTLVIRDLQVNAEGDVFLLYTAGAVPGDQWGDWTVDLADEAGRRYQPGETFQPFWRDGSQRGGRATSSLARSWRAAGGCRSSARARRGRAALPLRSTSSRSPSTVRM